MLVKIAFFDKYQDEDYLRQTSMCNFVVASKQPIVSANIRLRKHKGNVFTFNMDRYYSSVTTFSYGMLYTLDISEEEFEWLDNILRGYDYVRDNTFVTIIETNYQDFLKHKYQIKSKSVNCFCYTTSTNEQYQTIYKNRHLSVNFHKTFLLNIL